MIHDWPDGDRVRPPRRPFGAVLAIAFGGSIIALLLLPLLLWLFS